MLQHKLAAFSTASQSSAKADATSFATMTHKAAALQSHNHICNSSHTSSSIKRTASYLTCRTSSVVSVSVALAEPSASRGSSPLVMRHCLAGASPEQVQVRLSVVSTGTATVSTGMLGLYLATRRAVEPPLVNTTIKDACTCNSTD